MSEGSEFHLAFFNNLQIKPAGVLSKADIRVCVSNIDEISQNIEFSYDSNVDRIDIDPGSSVNSDLPVDLLCGYKISEKWTKVSLSDPLMGQSCL